MTPELLELLAPPAPAGGAPAGPTLADRALALGAGGAAEVLAAAAALAASGHHVVRLEVGEPDAPTPPHVVEAGVRALRAGHTRYGPPAGLPELRAAVAESLRARGVPADPARVVVTPGAKAMIFATLLAAVRPGDEVLVPDPGYPAYAAVAEFAGGRAVRYRLRAERGFGVDVGEVAARCTLRTRVLVLNTPHNPTGGVADPAALAGLAALAAERDLLVLSDEVYARHAYGEAPHEGGPAGIAALPGAAARTVVVDGFSKAYAMTGWRLGYGLLPPALVGPVTALVANSASCTPAFVQHAGLAALAGPQDWVAAQAAEFRRRRDQLVAALNGIDGVRCATPGGAFYAFPSVAGVLARGGPADGTLAADTLAADTLATEAFARHLLERHGLACVPGTVFGPAGAGHLRLAYTASREDLALAVERLRAGAAAWAERS